MRVLRFLAALAAIAVLYTVSQLEAVEIGEQAPLLYASLISLAALSLSDRAARFSPIAAAVFTVAAIDAAIHNLLLHGLPVYAYYSVRIPLAVAIVASAAAIVEFSERAAVAAAASAASFATAALALYVVLSLLGFVTAAIAVAAAFLILSATSAASAFSSRLSHVLRVQRSFLLAVILVLTVYATVLKPHLSDRPGLVSFAEWLIVVVVFLKLANDVRKSFVAFEDEIVAAHSTRFAKERLAEALDASVEKFVESGDKAAFVAALAAYLSSSGVDVEEIADVIAPIVDYRDEQVPRLAIPWERRLIERRNRRRRERLVENLRARFAPPG